MSPEAAAQAREEAARNPRYKWLGELSPGRARALIGRSHLLCLTSEMEGGANVLSEAAAAGTPILASRIACTEGLLGSDYPGLFPVGDERALSAALLRAERDPAFLADLERRALALGETLSPAAEKAAWAALLAAIPVKRTDSILKLAGYEADLPRSALGLELGRVVSSCGRRSVKVAP